MPEIDSPTKRKPRRALTISLFAVAGIFALAACADETDAKPSSSPTSVETPTPSPTPTETESPDSKAIEQALAPYESIKLADFVALPRSEHDKFAALILKRDMQRFAEVWGKETKNPEDELPTASVNNSAQEIDDLGGWQNRLVFSLSGDEREKYRISIYHDGAASPEYAAFQKDVDSHPQAIKPGVQAYNNYIPQETANEQASGPVSKDGNGEIYRDIISTGNGSTHTVRIYYKEVTILDNEVLAFWQDN